MSRVLLFKSNPNGCSHFSEPVFERNRKKKKEKRKKEHFFFVPFCFENNNNNNKILLSQFVKAEIVLRKIILKEIE